MRTLSLVLASTWLSMACVGAPPPPPVSEASSDTTMGPASTTTPGTTMPGDGTMNTQGGTSTDTTAGANPTTSGSESSSGPPPECKGPRDCSSNEICEDGTCVEICGGAWGVGSYGYCLTDYGGFDTDTICGPGHRCVLWGDPIEQTACALQDCVDNCDCPPPPATGNATVSCGPFIDVMNGCYLSCANGETCPDGMSCADGVFCATNVPEVPVYGDCGNLASECEGMGFCVVGLNGESGCVVSCANVNDCPEAVPVGGRAAPACSDITPVSGGLECYLSCIDGLACPDGMTCLNGTVCLWPD
jgi:hypothetical protein